MEKLSKPDEDRILQAIDRVSGLVNDGSDPNEAMAKVASDMHLPLGHIDLMVHAYNTGRTNMQRKTHDDIYEKAAEFPLADSQIITKLMYPDTHKSAAEKQRLVALSSEYSRTPVWIDRMCKAASVMTKEAFATAVKVPQKTAPVAEAEDAAKKAFNTVKFAKQRLNTFKADGCALELGCDKLVEDLRGYFKIAGHVSFNEASEYAKYMFGDGVQPALDLVAKELPKSITKQASNSNIRNWKQASKASAPYSAIGELASNLTASTRFHEKLAEAQKAVEQLEDQLLRPFGGSPRTRSVLEGHLSSEKAAWSVLGNVFDTGSNVFNNKAQTIGTELSPFKDTDKLRAKDMQKLVDPYHEADLREAQVEAMLNDLMANDEVISTHKPDDVIRVFNEVNQIAPRAADQKLLVRALLRKRLQYGGDQVDPFDVQQLLDIETKLKERENLGRAGLSGYMGVGPMGQIGT